MEEAEKPSIQQIQNARLKLAFLLSSSRLANPASLYQNTEFMKFVFLEFYLRDTMFSNARFASFLKDMRPVSLYQNTELMKSAF